VVVVAVIEVDDRIIIIIIIIMTGIVVVVRVEEEDVVIINEVVVVLVVDVRRMIQLDIWNAMRVVEVDVIIEEEQVDAVIELGVEKEGVVVQHDRA
jgi:hypothetical protein